MSFDREELKKAHPREIRAMMREGKFKDHTMKLSEGYTQANMAIIPKRHALEFMIFCQRNPAPCPVLEVTEPGVPTLKYLSDIADLRTDLPQYRVFKEGVCVDEPYDINEYWRDDLVVFLIGCSATFDHVLNASGISLRHFEQNKVPSVYITSLECEKAGPFESHLVVSERPIKLRQLNQVIQITSRFPLMHGAPIHVGDPNLIGIEDMGKVDWGDPSEVLDDEIACFWACGVTPQTAALRAKLDLVITHYPAKMFISDRRNQDFATIN